MKDTTKDHRLIEALHDSWIAAELEGRPDDLLGLCTEDIVLQPPVGAAVSGRQAVGELLRTSAGGIAEIAISDLSIEVSGALAVKRARFRTVPACGAAPVSGTHLWLLRRRWKVAFVTWSLDEPPRDVG